MSAPQTKTIEQLTADNAKLIGFVRTMSTAPVDVPADKEMLLLALTVSAVVAKDILQQVGADG